MPLRTSSRPVAALGLACALVLAILAPDARAADAVFPASSRFGFTTPSDMAPSRRFTGFERTEGGATLQIVELAPQAYPELQQSFTDESLRTQGFVVEKREPVKVAGDIDATLLSGEQPAAETQGVPAIRKWLLLVGAPDVTGIIIAQMTPGAESEEVMRATLLGVALRSARTLDQQVDALPFRIANPAGFRTVRVLAGNSVLMTRGPKDELPALEQPILVMAQAVQPPTPTEQREGFARAALYSNQTMKDFVIERSQSYRSNGIDWHEIVARATDLPSGTPVVVAQTIRFAPDGYLRAVGVVRADQREDALPLFREVVDSVEIK